MARKSTSKQPKSAKASARSWLENQLESSMLDLEALSSMPVDQVNEDLQEHRSATNPSFIAALNKRLPEEARIQIASPAKSPRKAASKPRRSRADRPAVPVTPSVTSRSSLRLFSIRNAFIISTLIILIALILPGIIVSMRESNPEPAVIRPTPVLPEDSQRRTPPTRIEGTFPQLRLRGVHYVTEGFATLPIETPLPPNPDSLQAVFKARITVNSQGGVQHLEMLESPETPLGNAVIDSLLMWRFGNGAAPMPDSSTGLVTVIYAAESR